MTYTFRPATRENTPLIIGLAGPTKSGKTYSALRLAVGLANGGTIAMLNAEGARGHLYAETFTYVSCEIEPPYRPMAYTEALQSTHAAEPAVVIIDSASHMHDGPGGVLEWHEEELDRMAGDDLKKRERATWAAWVQPKAAENRFIYQMLAMRVPIILCMRAKEKVRIVKGAEPTFEWAPIVGERLAFETLFTLMLLPRANGVPDLRLSEMREPFGKMFALGQQIDEAAGQRLAAWAKGTPAIRPLDPVVPKHIATNLFAPLPPDEYLAQLHRVATAEERLELWRAVTNPDVWNALTGSEQKRLLAANAIAKTRVGG